MNIRVLAALALPPALAACSPQAAEPPLAGARIGGPFALVDQDGRAVRDTSWPGKYRVMYFGFTFCPDVCPVDVQAIADGVRRLAARDPDAAAKVQPVFVTVDPARDTPAVVRQYVRAFSPTMAGLTGPEPAIAAVAKAYGVFYSRDEPRPGATGYLVNHSRQAVLFGPDGKPIALLPSDKGGQAVADELAKWVR